MAELKRKVLFLCTGNSCRSQMAEGWCRHLHGEVIESFSAGIEKHGLNPFAVKVMRDAGVDISGHFSKLIDELPTVDFDLVVTVCGHADVNCPVFPGPVPVIHQPFDDPPRLAANITDKYEKTACYQRVCDEILAFVKELPLVLAE
ncbi:MAG: arsenate reductase ArsC [Thermodesulfobacteriota bacterium]|nr:arsenate reductase ArsC [Thermodesulfobacteriota bacterium]